MSLMTIAKIRKVYNKFDAKCIAKQLGMSAHENATPIRILHNSAAHLSGPARSFGAILMGYLGWWLGCSHFSFLGKLSVSQLICISVIYIMMPTNVQ